jgi:hypothetical protein
MPLTGYIMLFGTNVLVIENSSGEINHVYVNYYYLQIGIKYPLVKVRLDYLTFERRL